MKARYLPVVALIVLALTACGAKAAEYTCQQAIDALKAAGLEAESPRVMTKDDYGLAPMLATEGMRFLIPSLCDDCGGRVFAFSSSEDLDKTKTFYDELGKQSALFFSWTFAQGNILIQINGDLPEDQAKKYEQALGTLGQ